MTEQIEHRVEVNVFRGAWQRSHRLVQASCTCGWEGKRDFVPHDVAEAEARRHLASVEEDAG
jgi:hypothetical protein